MNKLLLVHSEVFMLLITIITFEYYDSKVFNKVKLTHIHSWSRVITYSSHSAINLINYNNLILLLSFINVITYETTCIRNLYNSRVAAEVKFMNGIKFKFYKVNEWTGSKRQVT